MKNFKKVLFSLAATSLIIVLSACSLPGLHNGKSTDTIRVASGNASESQILSNLVIEMITHYTDSKTVLINNLGSDTVLQQAMNHGDADITAGRYTGTALTGTLGLEPEKDPAKALATVKKEFQSRYDQTWFPSYGFANTYAFMVTQEEAKKDNLEKISDLKNFAPKMSAGVDSSWMNRKGDGYKGFTQAYDFDFNRVYPMQIGLVYNALQADKMDVVLGYSTDGRINSYNLKILEDDKNFFPPYDASLVATNKVLKDNPKLKKVLLKLSGKINTKTMQQLNYRADNDLVEPSVVAKEFLEKNNYFEDK